ncbi:hypothetical protein JCM14469_12640 [Desulfatiferula olefinivorans]
MDVNSVNASVPVERQTMNTENQETRRPEPAQTAPPANTEAYRVELSEDARTAQATGTVTPPEGMGAGSSEAVQTYTRAGQIAG